VNSLPRPPTQENSQLKAQLSAARAVAKEREELPAKVDALAAEATALRDEVHGLNETVQALEGERASGNRAIMKQERRNSKLRRKVDSLRRLAEDADVEADEATQQAAALRDEMQGLNQTAQHLEGMRACDNRAILKQERRNSKLRRKVDSLQHAEAEATRQADALRGQVVALNQNLEDVGCCSICFEGPPAAGFLHGDTVHR
jgi:predicted  nucleic acid-binding Zn-ribbon protein